MMKFKWWFEQGSKHNLEAQISHNQTSQVPVILRATTKGYTSRDEYNPLIVIGLAWLSKVEYQYV